MCAELKTAKSDRDAMKFQSESLSKEYDRVSSELQRLQVRDLLFVSVLPLISFLQKESDDDGKKEQ